MINSLPLNHIRLRNQLLFWTLIIFYFVAIILKIYHNQLILPQLTSFSLICLYVTHRKSLQDGHFSNLRGPSPIPLNRLFWRSLWLAMDSAWRAMSTEGANLMRYESSSISMFAPGIQKWAEKTVGNGLDSLLRFYLSYFDILWCVLTGFTFFTG